MGKSEKVMKHRNIFVCSIKAVYWQCTFLTKEKDLFVPQSRYRNFLWLGGSISQGMRRSSSRQMFSTRWANIGKCLVNTSEWMDEYYSQSNMVRLYYGSFPENTHYSLPLSVYQFTIVRLANKCGVSNWDKLGHVSFNSIIYWHSLTLCNSFLFIP